MQNTYCKEVYSFIHGTAILDQLLDVSTSMLGAAKEGLLQHQGYIKEWGITLFSHRASDEGRWEEGGRVLNPHTDWVWGQCPKTDEKSKV